MNHHYLLYPSFYLIFLTGCATENVQRPHYGNNKITQAESFMQRGQPKKAAHLYQTLARSKPAHHGQFNLLAAEAYIQSGDNYSAQKLVNTINPSSLSGKQNNKLNLLYAQIHLSNGEAEQALKRLKLTKIYNLQNNDKIIFYQSLAFAHSLTENQLLSAKARIQLTPLLDSSEKRYRNNRVIFNTLNLLSLQTLTLNQPAAPEVLRGWIALTRLFKSSQQRQDLASLETDLYDWKRLYPRHPANSDFLETYLENSKHLINIPSSIALFLPETGRFAQAAQAIKEGFMAAYYQNEYDFQPSLRFYDSSSYHPVDLYHQAISDGADLIIGPLSKDNIQTLAYDAELTTPVLALNHIPNLVADNLFQFGLSPIDEIKQIASRAKINGVKKILLITPETRKGNRIANSLTEYWQDIGGSLLNSQTYNAKKNDFSTPIKALLKLSESEDRYTRLKRFLATDIQYTERIRKDADAIFLSATPKTARSIYPQLRFYGATDIPVYALTQVYTGVSNPSLDRDLNNITFCDIPWLFSDTYTGSLSPESLSEVTQLFPSKYLRLIALGIDSFNLINHLNQIDTMPYLGATGKLSLNQDNRITRQLVCSKFVKGIAVLESPLYEQNIQIDDQNNTYSEDFIR